MSTVGAPPLFKSVEEIEKKIEEYYFFLSGDFEMQDMINPLTELPEKVKVYTLIRPSKVFKSENSTSCMLR